MPTQNSWNNQVTASGVTFTGGQIDIGTDAAAYNVNVGTGAAAKTVTVGNTSGASVLALKYGTGDYTLESASGTVMSALDSGEITAPLQPSFLAYLNVSVGNATGDGTFYTIKCDTELVDKGSDYNTGTGVFTAPVAGTYIFTHNLLVEAINSGHTAFFHRIVTTDKTYQINDSNPWAQSNAAYYGATMSVVAPMDAGDTASFTVFVAGGAKVVTVSAVETFVCGSLLN